MRERSWSGKDHDPAAQGFAAPSSPNRSGFLALLPLAALP